MRISYIVLFAVLCGLGACVYHVANLYQAVERQNRKLDVAIEREHENIRVLSAEWAFLTNPARLEKLALDYLQLQAMDGSQLVAISAVPLREHFEQVDDGDAIEAMLATMDAAPPARAPQMKMLPVNAGGYRE